MGARGTSKYKEAMRKRFGAAVAVARRTRLGLTQSLFARRLDIDKDYLSRVERGVVGASDQLRQRIAQAIGVSLTSLEREDDGPAPVAGEYPNRALVVAGDDFKRAHDIVKDELLGCAPARDLTHLQWLEVLQALIKLNELGVRRRT